jgi:adenine-specific DNA methylase
MADQRPVPRLIEVGLPVREISAESVRDKSLRHGHLSTLHLWFARRPLAASRAVVFASLVPDPDHPDCPPAFRAAVEQHLKTHVPEVLRSYRRGRAVHLDPDPYRPYDGQPDTLRNRLMMFIAKWSPEWLAFEGAKSDRPPRPENLLDDRSLVKWETSDPDSGQGSKVLWVARELVRAAHGNQVPAVLDPFAGGGAIPLEAGRLGCQAVANDYNPVAYLILRATCELPQRYGKPGVRKRAGELTATAVPNVLSHDVEVWATEILARARKKISHLYPAGSDGRPVVGYLWARTIPCANCRTRFPLLRSLLVCSTDRKKVALKMHRQGGTITFGIVKGDAIRETAGTMIPRGRGSARCPFCNQTNHAARDIKPRATGELGADLRFGEQMVAVITDTPGGKDYRAVEPSDLAAFQEAERLAETVERPGEPMPVRYTQAFPVCTWGFRTWGSLLSPRQLVAVQTLIETLHQVRPEIEKAHADEGDRKALLLYLGIWIDRVAQRSSTQGIWHVGRETLEHPFGGQAISLSWDFPEANPLSSSTGSALGQIGWIQRVIEHESLPAGIDLPAPRITVGDGTNLPLAAGVMSVTVTDPPYFDAISYSDLSDYFYIWLRRSLHDVFPEAFAVYEGFLTPKGEEATALKHRHGGSGADAREHFTGKLAQCLSEARRVTRPDGVISVLFAHQSTEAWTALIDALFEAGLTVTATYPIDTELTTALKSWKSTLATSITVTCRPRVRGARALFKDVKKEIEGVVADAIRRFWGYGFRGADLVVACYGPAVGAFGKYEMVENQGEPVGVPELLELVSASALAAIAGEFKGDRVSQLYFAWANLNGVGEEAWNDARLAVQVGDREDTIDLALHQGLFVLSGRVCRLALLADRAGRPLLGEKNGDPLIDRLHRAMLLWKAENRPALVRYLHRQELADHAGFWRLAQALFEVLPRDAEDRKLIRALLGERQTLRTEVKRHALAGSAEDRGEGEGGRREGGAGGEKDDIPHDPW